MSSSPRKGWWKRGVFVAASTALLSTFLPLAAAHAAATYIYASPNGTGSLPCASVSTPCSLANAQQAARNAIPTMNDNVVVWLLGGTYYLPGNYTCPDSTATNPLYGQTSTLCLTPADSGRNGFNVYYQNYLGQAVTISGGQRVSSAWDYTSSTGLFHTALSSSFDWHARQIYANGVRSRRAWGLENETPYYSIVSGGFQKNGAYPWSMASTWNFGNCAAAVSDCDIETVAMTADYAARCPVAYIDDSQHKLYVKQPCWSMENQVLGNLFPQAGPMYVENAYQLLLSPDNTGQYYLNQRTGDLYYRPRPGEFSCAPTCTLTANIVVPKLTVDVGLLGSSVTTPVHNIQMIGLTFADTAFDSYGPTPVTTPPVLGAPGAYAADNSPDYGYVDFRGPEYATSCLSSGACPKYIVMPPAGVVASRSANLQFSQDTFTRMGGAGIEFPYGVDSNTGSSVYQSTFNDISSSGIIVGGVSSFVCPNNQAYCNVGSDGHTGTDPHDALANINIQGNAVSDVAKEYYGAAAIIETFAHNANIFSNTVHNTSYCGICSGTSNLIGPSEQENLRIYNNYLYDVFRMGADGGAVDIMDNNAGWDYVHSVQYSPPHTAAIYGNTIKDSGNSRPQWAGANGSEFYDLEDGATNINVYANTSYHLHGAVPGLSSLNWIVMGGINDVAGYDLNGNAAPNYSDNTSVICDTNPNWGYGAQPPNGGCPNVTPSNVWGRAVAVSEPDLITSGGETFYGSSAYDQPVGNTGGSYGVAHGGDGSELEAGWISNPCLPGASPHGYSDPDCAGGFGPRWWVDLGASHPISRLAFVARGDYDVLHRRDFEVLGSNDNFATYTVLASVGHDGFGVPVGPVGTTTNWGGSTWEVPLSGAAYRYIMICKTTTEADSFAMNELHLFS